MRVIQKALTFDDVLLLPAHSRVLPREVSLKTRLTRKLELNMPLVSAAMDTVTGARLPAPTRAPPSDPTRPQPVKAVMTPQRKLITVREGASRDEAKALMHQ